MTVHTHDRPLVTFALFAYNQEQYIRDAVEGAFAQTYEPLEIILSDDCSTDRTFEIMNELAQAYDGPHKVTVRRSAANRGLAGHVNEVLAAASTDIVMFAAGDDISLPQRAAETLRLFDAHPDALAVSFATILIDEQGREMKPAHASPRGAELSVFSLRDLFAWCVLSPGCTRAIRREVFERFGPLAPGCPTEDTPFLLRSLLMGPILHSSRILVRYRIHDANLSGRLNASRMQQQSSMIVSQYHKDLEIAASEGLIDPSTARMVRKWIADSAKLRTLRLNMQQTPPSLDVALRTLSCSGLSKRSTLGYWKIYLKHLMRLR